MFLRYLQDILCPDFGQACCLNQKKSDHFANQTDLRCSCGIEVRLPLVFHQNQEIQEILSWFYFESRQDQNKKLEIDFKTRQEIVIKTKIS